MTFYRLVNKKHVSGFYSWFVYELHENIDEGNVWLVSW